MADVAKGYSALRDVLVYQPQSLKSEKLKAKYLGRGGCRQVVKASDCGSDIRGFDPHHPPHIYKRASCEALFLRMNGDTTSRVVLLKKCSTIRIFSSAESIIRPIFKKSFLRGSLK